MIFQVAGTHRYITASRTPCTVPGGGSIFGGVSEIDPRRIAFGCRIRALRTAAGQTQAQVAAASGIYAGYISEIELGHANITFDNMMSLADPFGVTPASLLEDP